MVIDPRHDPVMLNLFRSPWTAERSGRGGPPILGARPRRAPPPAAGSARSRRPRREVLARHATPAAPITSVARYRR